MLPNLTPPPPEAGPGAAEVQSVLTRARVAVLRRDRATLEEVLHADYICVYPDGRILNREQRIHLALAGTPNPASLTIHDGGDILVRLLDNTAVVTEVIRQSSLRAGNDALDEWVATSVLYRQAGRWSIVSVQLTSVRNR